MPAEPRKHAHYFKEVPTTEIDVYAVLRAFEVTHPCLQHALKKLLVAGKRGSKSFQQDVQEAIDTLERGLEMERQAQKPHRPAGLVVEHSPAAGSIFPEFQIGVPVPMGIQRHSVPSPSDLATRDGWPGGYRRSDEGWGAKG